MKKKNRVNWDETEDIGTITHYKGNPFTGICYDLHENGDLSEEYEMLNGLKHGYGKLFNKDGQLELEGNYKDDVLTDGWFKIWENGKLKEEREIIDGNPISFKPSIFLSIFPIFFMF